MGTINVLSKVLASRILVLVAILGGVGLTWLALANPDPMRLGVLGIYFALCVVPTIGLACWEVTR